MGTHPIFESDFDCLTDAEDPRINSKAMSSLQRQLGIGKSVFQAHESAIQSVNRAINKSSS